MFFTMKKFLFIATIVALILGTAIDADAKRRPRKKRQQNVPVQTTGSELPRYTQEGVARLDNGDVADLEMAFIQNLYYQYVIPGTISNENYFRYVSLMFTDGALNMLKDANGNYDWSPIEGKANGATGFTPAFKVTNLGNRIYVVEEGNNKCYFEVTGGEGAYKIARVSTQPLN